MPSFIFVAASWLTVAIVMGVLWAIQRRTKNAAIVDVAWSFATGLCGIAFAWQATGWGPRRLLAAIIVGVWAVRLGAHLAHRVSSEREDVRYRKMREEWGGRTQWFLFGFFQIQALWAVLFAIPVAAAATNPLPGFRITDALAVVIALVAVGGEGLADRQLARFRANPANRGKVCREGLWNWTRHPNYFFEWLGWWAYVGLAFGGSGQWLSLLGPVTMLFFLLRITGVPPTEARLLESRGDAYRAYQASTSVFFPWPPKDPSQKSRLSS